MDKDERMRLEEEGLKKTNGRIKMKEDKSRKRRNNGIRLMEEEDEMTKQKKIGKQTSNMIDTERSKVTKFRYKTVVKVSFDL